MTQSIILAGNAASEGAVNRGWLLGHFIKQGVFHSTDIEIKWGVHTAGEQRSSLHAPDPRIKTLSILLAGKFKANFGEEEIRWNKEGDYLYWTHNLPHTAEMLKDSVILTVRWPSISSDSPKPTEDNQTPIMAQGNATDDAQTGNGWIIGFTLDKKSPLYSEDIGIKWSVLEKGDRRESVHPEIEGLHTLQILVRGKMKILIGGEEKIQENMGEYLYWNNNQSHTSEALEGSVCLTIRWPANKLL